MRVLPSEFDQPLSKCSETDVRGSPNVPCDNDEVANLPLNAANSARLFHYANGGEECSYWQCILLCVWGSARHRLSRRAIAQAVLSHPVPVRSNGLQAG